MQDQAEQVFSFAEFELDVAHCQLRRDGVPLPLHGKAFDLLVFLVENAGRVVSREEIFESVWHGQLVEESNLTVQVSALRKMLNDQKNAARFLITVPGKGYKFIAEVRTTEAIVIESHKYSRLVVEEEIDGEIGRAGETEQERVVKPAAPLFPISRSQKLAAGLVATVLIGSAAFWFYPLRNANQQRQPGSLQLTGRQPSSRVFATINGIPQVVAISPDGKTLAYVQRFKGQHSLWLGDIETNNSVQIIPPSNRWYRYLTFAPDGKSLYFTVRDDHHQQWTLLRTSIFGGAVKELIADVHSALTFSPDGKSLAFLRKATEGNNTWLITADVEDGKNERVLFQREKLESFRGSGVSWSPDGQQIAFGVLREDGKGYEVLTVNAQDGRIAKIGNAIWSKGMNLVWVRDGSGLVVLSSDEVGDSGQTQLVLLSYPGGEARQITNSTLSFFHPSLSISADDRVAILQARVDLTIWIAALGDLHNPRQLLEGSRAGAEGMYGLAAAPDGHLLYAAKTGDSRTIWEMTRDGGHPRQLTPSEKDSDDMQISVTADNRFLVFQSNRSGEEEIWRANRDGSNLRRLTTGGGNSRPTLSPDGLWVLYTSARDGKSTTWRVSIEGGEPQQLTSEETSWAAVSPDGKYFACAYGKYVQSIHQSIAIYSLADRRLIKTLPIAFSGVMFNRLRWSPDGKAIIYKDAAQGLWRQDLDKIKPEAVKDLDDLRVYHFAFTPDSKQLIYSGGVQMREIIILENIR